MMKGTIRKVGNSEGVIIPKEVLQRLGLSRGDSLELREVEGNIRLVPESADLAEQVRAARIGMEKYRVALRESARRLKICMTSRSPSTAVCLASGMPTHWKPVWHGRSTRSAHGETDIFVFAAAYLYAIVRNHPFKDGNKRTGYLAAFTFLYQPLRHQCR